MTDTVAILTGASRGLGAALARGLLAPGTRLITLARRADPDLEAAARTRGASLEQVQVDLSDPAAAGAAAERLCAALPRDARRYLLINNAGTVSPVAQAAGLTDGAAIAGDAALRVAHQRHHGGIEPYRHATLTQAEQRTRNERVAGPDIGAPGKPGVIDRIASQRSYDANEIPERA
ncbi:SDR family NAD(P)-dependent oxidoreductase, partial [Bordetella bronchiseptica]|uniref:SDR family NAD(P)-dependent oxidoreductase n=1 Tax=Bordetella bronchiseptica TaxID=518 RepID=UPI000461880A